MSTRVGYSRRTVSTSQITPRVQSGEPEPTPRSSSRSDLDPQVANPSSSQRGSSSPQQVEHADHLPQQTRPPLWREIAMIVGFYAVYSFVRNLHGSQISVEAALRNAHDIVNLEKALGMFHELQVQEFFLQWPGVVKFLNVWYGSAHFVVTIGVLFWLYFRTSQRYRKWRNVLLFTTCFALVGYVIYPLTPPRLLDPSFGFEDTLKTIGGLWNFDDGAIAKASNQHAAMPSLHVAWALWCSLALIPILRHAWSRILMSLYPALTILTIVATANHYWLDVAGGAAVLAAGYALAHLRERFRRQTGRATDDSLLSVST